jgi:DNA-binding LacI/PurR family transcriptional regulator
MPQVTLVIEAETLIRNWLNASDIREGGRLPSERALAKVLNVRHYAVNRAMARLIAEGVVSRDGYKLYRNARHQSSASFSCELVVYRRSIHLRSFRKVARELGIDLHMHCYSNLEEAVSFMLQLEAEKVESIILDPPLFGFSTLGKVAESLIKEGVPIVCADNYLREMSSVFSDLPRALELCIDHLIDLGHREMAIMGMNEFSPTAVETLQTWKSACTRHDMQLSSERICLPSKYLFLREEIADLADRFAEDWRNVTALIAYNEPNSTIPCLMEFLAKRKINVPKDLSIISLSDSSILSTLTPPVSAASFDIGMIHEMAFRVDQRLARRQRGMGIYSTSHIRIQPNLVQRGSTIPNSRAVAEHQVRPATSEHALTFLELGRNRANVEKAYQSDIKRPYSLVKFLDNSRFDQLNLQEFVNRPLNYQRGWLGDRPLKHLDPGQYTIHGVPFNVLGGPHRSDCGVIVFNSIVNTKGKAQNLPVRLRIPIRKKAKAVYFLHGCGFTRFLKCFAYYRFYSGANKIGEIPLVPLGLPPADFDPGIQTLDFSKINIQDWWTDLPHMHFEHAMMAPILEGGVSDGSSPHWYVFLYTLEWINPVPNKVIDYLEIEVAPSMSTTLGVLAVSVLKSWIISL